MIPSRVKIYDFEHGPGDVETRDPAWLESIFGPCINVHPVTEIYQPQMGEIVYQLQWINCKAGNASCIIEVKDVNGEPDIGKTVVFGWSTAEEHGLADQGWNWTPNGAPGKTEPPDSHVGPGMSTGSYYSPDQGECGPHFIWIWDRPSEMVDGVGMLPFHDDVPGANHIHTEYGFRAVRWGEEPPPPPDGDLLGEVRRIRVATEAILEHLTGQPPPPPVDEVFRGEYYDNVDLSGTPALVRDDPEISFSWGEGKPAPEITSDYFSVRWTGKRTFEGRTYTFKVLVDDGIRLWLDGNLLIESWKDQPPTPHQANVALTAGQHDIKVEYYERAGGATCLVWWE